MRGADITQEELFSYRTLEGRIPKHNPLRKLRKVIDFLFTTLDDEFNALYARRGRDSNRRVCCAPVCYKFCFPSAPSGSWWNISTSTSCTAGSSD